MQDIQHATYKGYFVSTRKAVHNPGRASWKQFPTVAFRTVIAAIANALLAAKRSIGRDIYESGGWGLCCAAARERNANRSGRQRTDQCGGR
jgi:hypothetical protein